MIKKISALVVSIALLAGVWQAENIQEWWWLRNYQPSVAVAALADRASLNDSGRREFYLGDPAVDDKQSFSSHCPVGEVSLVLGCYSGGKIYILKVERAELAGVMEVTAAHEMLHAAYAELSAGERRRVDQLLEGFYSQHNDPELDRLVAEYEQTEPGQRLNELHSLLGTQVAKLSRELEEYYERYFTNRQKVVTAYLAYKNVFTQLENRIEALNSEIDSLRAQITSLEGQINSQRAKLEATNQQLDNLLAANQTSQYNALVPQQNAQVSVYNALVSQYRSLIAAHNSKVEQVNRLALEQNQLVDALDSTKFNPIQN